MHGLFGVGLILVCAGAALMFVLRPRARTPVRLRAVPAFDILAPLAILGLLIAGGVLLIVGGGPS